MPTEYSPALVARFWSHVDKTGDCWLWTRSVKPTGYGQTWDGARFCYAHRLAYELSIGPVPPGMFVCHHCDRRTCCRPEHLFVGTHSDNMQDMLSKGRAGHLTKPESRARGDRNGRRLHPERYPTVVIPKPHPGTSNYAAKLTDEDVREIRRAYAAGESNQRQLGERFGVSQVKVSQIVLGKAWKHLL